MVTKYMVDIVTDLTKTPIIQQSLTELLVKGLETDNVKQCSKTLVKDLFENDEIIEYTAKFVKQVISRTDVTETASNSGWIIVKKMFTPGFIKNKPSE